MSKQTYFAQDEASELVSYMDKRSFQWFNTLSESNLLDKVERSWQAYHGQYYDSAHSISYGGEQGELVNLAVNHYENIAQNILTMVTSTRPAFQARAVNTDYKSQAQTTLANGLLEYYMRDKRLEQYLKKAVEYAVVMGSGFIKMEWNSTSGKIYDYSDPEINELTGEEIRPSYPIYEGDVEFNVLSPFDVVFDSTKETAKHDWQLCRTFKNKFDLAAKYPELEEEILAVKTKSETQSRRIALTPFDETVDVPVYEFFHKPTESLPKGRYVLYLNKDCILVDTVLPYRNLPLFRISARDILGTPYGYTVMWNLLPIQDAVNSLYSTILTNQSTFGVQNIYAQRDANITMAELSSGLNLIEGDPNTAPPQALNLTQTPGEIFNFLQMLERAMETVSGINSVARGNPDPKQNLRSGNALALIQSQALQFISGLQNSYIHLIEDVGTNLIYLLQDFASVPRVAEITGKASASLMEEFTGDDLSDIHRVIVDVANALAQTTAGKLEIAESLLQMGLIKTAQDYLSVLNTGKLETMTEGPTKENMYIRSENEDLFSGKTEVMALLTDDHLLHIQEHKFVLADAKLKQDPALVDRVLGHIQEHINILSNPALATTLQVMGQTPIPPMMPPQGGEGAPPAVASPQAGSPQGDVIPPEALAPDLQTQMSGQLPQPAQPAQAPNGAPTTGAEAMAQQIAPPITGQE
jgi:hypothetical protein